MHGQDEELKVKKEKQNGTVFLKDLNILRTIDSKLKNYQNLSLNPFYILSLLSSCWSIVNCGSGHFCVVLD